ncbi:MAG TPA: hypothetical protein VMT10_10180 [Solirubrobacteraceae bacterium]|nr:hypothetical protein [Solirubrobacteraceae bacterium]
MLFDLRGRGRRRTVQVIYLGLAVILGAGLVFFGIGGATNGGLLNAINGKSSSTGSSLYDKRVKQYERAVAVNPKDEQAWAALAKARVQQASVVGYSQATGQYTAKGLAGLEQASAAWKRYLALNPKKPDDTVASLMVAAYGTSGLNQPTDAANALDAVIAGRGPSAALYTQLAIQRYVAGDTRGSLIAGKHALELTPPSKRLQAKAQLTLERKQIDQARVQQATQNATSTSTNPLGGG